MDKVKVTQHIPSYYSGLEPKQYEIYEGGIKYIPFIYIRIGTDNFLDLRQANGSIVAIYLNVEKEEVFWHVLAHINTPNIQVFDEIKDFKSLKSEYQGKIKDILND